MEGRPLWRPIEDGTAPVPPINSVIYPNRKFRPAG
jgi:hypothetical protein